MRWNLPLWFIPCMISTSIIVWGFELIIIKNSRHNLISRMIMVLDLAVIGSALPYFIDIKLPFQLESGIYMASFLELGILFRSLDIHNRIDRGGKGGALGKSVTAVAFISVAVALIHFNGFAEVRIYDYGKYFGVHFVTSLLLCMAVIIIAMMINNCPIIEALGRNTFPILLMHKFPILFFQSIMPGTKGWLNKPDTFIGMVCALMVTIVVLILCMLGTTIIRKILPLVIGETAKLEISDS